MKYVPCNDYDYDYLYGYNYDYDYLVKLHWSLSKMARANWSRTLFSLAIITASIAWRLSVFKMTARFADVSESQIEQFTENAVPQKTKDATKFGVKLFKGRLVN